MAPLKTTKKTLNQSLFRGTTWGRVIALVVMGGRVNYSFLGWGDGGGYG